MKRFLIILAAFMVVSNWQLLWAYASGGVGYDPAVHGEVTLLVTATCPYCRKMRRYLDASDVPYTEYDVERSAEGQRRFREVGAAGVPVVIVGDSVIYGFDVRGLRAAFGPD